ncbi:MAG: hypothetical protein BalsKO_25140 [Balneolaceae bacterium]
MFKAFKNLVFLFLLFFTSGELLAQRIVIDAIELSIPTRTGDSKLPTYSNFIEKTKNPALFRTQNIDELSRTNSTSKNAFSIDFIFRLKNNAKHQFIGGFEAATFNSDLYELSGIFQDSLLASTSLSTKNEFFFLKTGYNYVRTPNKRFTFMGGILFNFGIPVSATTTEVISLNDAFFIEQEYSFFAKQSATFGLNIPLGVRFKVINNISFSFTTNPGFQYQQIDGNPILTTFQGANFSFYFKLRER